VVACAPGQQASKFTGVPGMRVGTTEDLFAADAVLACSGTITLELALAGIPTVAAYRLSRLSYQLAKRLVGLKYISLPNILLDEPLVAEHIQELTADRLAADVLRVSEQRGRFYRSALALREILDHGDPIENASRALAPWLGQNTVSAS